MASPDVDSKGITSRGADFWDEEKSDIFMKTFLYDGKITRNQLDRTDDFVRQTLPMLAQYFDGKALDGLKQANPELAVFEPSSTSSWEEAKSAFINNGPAFLEVLAEYTDLIRFESQIGFIVTWDPVICTQLLLAIRDEIKSMKEVYQTEGSGKLDERVAQLSTTITEKISNADKAEDITSSRINALLSNHFNALEGQLFYSKVNLR